MTFEQFWPEYLRAHNHPVTRIVHVGGTLVALACIGLSVVMLEPLLLLAGVLLAYGAAWASHALVEGNMPKTLSHPIWSLRADLRMLRLALTGKLNEEISAHTTRTREPVD